MTSNDGAMGGFEMDENMNEYIHTCCIQMSGIFLISYFIHNPNGGELIVPILFSDGYFSIKKGVLNSKIT